MVKFAVLLAVALLATLCCVACSAKTTSQLLAIVNNDAIAVFNDKTGTYKVLLNVTEVMTSRPYSAHIYSLTSLGSCVAFPFWAYVDDGSNTYLGKYCPGDDNLTLIDVDPSFNQQGSSVFFDASLDGLILVAPIRTSYNGFQASFYNFRNGNVQTPIRQSDTKATGSFMGLAYLSTTDEVVAFAPTSDGATIGLGYSILTGVQMLDQTFSVSGGFKLLSCDPFEANSTFVGISTDGKNAPAIITLIDDQGEISLNTVMSTGIPLTKSTFQSSSLISSTAQYFVTFENVVGFQLYIYDINKGTLVNKFTALDDELSHFVEVKSA